MTDDDKKVKSIEKPGTASAGSSSSDLLCCPDCGGAVKYYHSSIAHGDGITRVVCLKKCQGWKVLKEIDRNFMAALY
jgi:hypothetical protein